MENSTSKNIIINALGNFPTDNLEPLVSKYYNTSGFEQNSQSVGKLKEK